MAQFSGNIGIGTGQTDKYSLLLWIEEKSYSVENNTSQVEWWVGIRSNTSYHSHYGLSETYTVVINGSTVHSAVHTPTVNAGATVWVASGTITISHNADGSKSISASASFNNADRGTYLPTTGSCSGSLTLTTIPRATAPFVDKPSLDCGSVIKFTGTSASSNFSHKLYTTWNNEEKLIATIAKGSTAVSYSYTIPTDWEKNMSNTTSAIATFILETLSGNTVIGRRSINATVKVRSGILPVIGTQKLEDTNTICHAMGLYVQSQSRIKFTIPTSGNQGSTITSVSTKIDGQTYNSGAFTTRVIQGSGSLTYTITVTDSRGRTATKSGSINVVAYNPPSLTNVSAKRANFSYVIDELDGTYALLHFKVGFTSLSNKNVTSFYIQYRASGASSWTKINSWANNYTLEQDYTAGNLFTSTTSAYEVAFGVKDSFMSDYSWQIVTVTPTYTLINFGKDGKSLTFFGQDGNNANQLTINGGMRVNELAINDKIQHSHEISDNGNTDDYFKLCQIKINNWYVNYPIEICYFQRGSQTTTKLNILFNSINTNDPSLNKFTYFGYCRGAYIVKASTSTWDIYAEKSENYDSIGIVYWSCKNPDVALNIIGSHEARVPDGYTKAINFEADMMYPVGAVYITYNNNNPGKFLGGIWEQFGQGRTLIGVGTGNDQIKSQSFNAHEMGGKYENSHHHVTPFGWDTNSFFAGRADGADNGNYDRTTVVPNGYKINISSSATPQVRLNWSDERKINVIQPYITVYFWRRTK